VPQNEQHARTSRGRGRTTRQSSSASTAPLTVTRANSTVSSSSDSTEPGLRYHQQQDGLGPIDEADSTDNLELSRPDVRRQDSTNSSSWLIPRDDGEFVLQLPAIGETTLHDDNIARTLPRRAPRLPGSALAGPGSSDPQRRRGLPISDHPQPADSWEKLNEGYKHDDDDDDDDVKTDAEVIRQNAVNMFKIALQQAEMMERDGLEASIEDLPVAGSGDQSPADYWGVSVA